MSAVKHTVKTPVTLREAMDRVPHLTQLMLEARSGVDRTRISKLCLDADARVLQETYDRLYKALRGLKALKANERLVFGQRASEAIAEAS